MDMKIEGGRQAFEGNIAKENITDTASGAMSRPSTELSALHSHIPTSPISKSAHVITYSSSGLAAAKTVSGPGSSPEGLSPVDLPKVL